jgi:PAS domain S-box-containing protein
VTEDCTTQPSWDENERLRALDSYGILDTPHEEDFEEVVKMAARVCRAPVSVINLIAGNRQWFKAEIGLGVRETPLDISICAKAILQPGVFTVPDLSEDPRFRENPLVTGDPRLRFYAGALLETPDGLPLGTMCILDYKPRILSEDELLTLKALARQVMTMLELRKALNAKSRSEERLSLALDASGFIGIWEWDVVKDLVYADERFVTVFGGEPSWSTEGAPIAEYIKAIHSDDFARVSSSIERALQSEGDFQQEYRLVQKDGSIRWIEARGKCHFAEDGKPIRFPGVAVDITDRKCAEFSDREAAEKARGRTEFLNQLTQKLSLLSSPEELNRVATREIGQFLGGNRSYFFEAIPPDLHTLVLSDWCLEEEKTLQGVYDLAVFGETEMWQTLNSRSVGLNDSAADPWTVKFVANYQAMNIGAALIAPFCRDGKWVTCLGVSSKSPRQWTPEERALLENVMLRVWPLIERARIELSLRESEERFRAMSDNIAPLAWMAKADGLIFWYNRRWYEYTGETFEEMKGDGWAKVQDPEHLPHVVESWKIAITNGTPWEDTFPLRGADGTFRWFLSRAFPIRDTDGNITLWFGVNTDITELREAQEALKHANILLGDKAALLDDLVKQRTQSLSDTIAELEAFSYSISHDMRAPLRSMIGFSEFLREDARDRLKPTEVDYLDRICSASRRMDQLIQDVLIFSRLSREDVVLTPIDTDVLMREIIASYPNLHPESIDIAIKATLPSVMGNASLLTQCFSNLLDNGAKFVAEDKEGKIEVWSEDHEGRVRIYFKDNGIGILEENQARIFDIFHRVGRGGEGTGIGLAIVRKAVEKMGGKIGIKSELGNGSLFWLDLAAP